MAGFSNILTTISEIEQALGLGYLLLRLSNMPGQSQWFFQAAKYHVEERHGARQFVASPLEGDLFLMSYVLIVDDDPDAREVLEDIVRSLGFETHAASDGLEALDVLRHIDRSPPSLITLDLMMPTMDGFTVYNWLRGNPTTRYVPVIVVTAMARNQLDMLRLPGVCAVIEKGKFGLETLSQLILRVVSKNDQLKVDHINTLGE